MPRVTNQGVAESMPAKKNLVDLKDETTTDDIPTADGQWMGDPNLRLHEERTKRAQRGYQSIVT